MDNDIQIFAIGTSYADSRQVITQECDPQMVQGFRFLGLQVTTSCASSRKNICMTRSRCSRQNIVTETWPRLSTKNSVQQDLQKKTKHKKKEKTRRRAERTIKKIKNDTLDGRQNEKLDKSTARLQTDLRNLDDGDSLLSKHAHTQCCHETRNLTLKPNRELLTQPPDPMHHTDTSLHRKTELMAGVEDVDVKPCACFLKVESIEDRRGPRSSLTRFRSGQHSAIPGYQSFVACCFSVEKKMKERAIVKKQVEFTRRDWPWRPCSPPCTRLLRGLSVSRRELINSSTLLINCRSSGRARARASLEKREVAVMATTEKEAVPGVIVGAGRVGQALERMGGGRDVVVRRGEKVAEDSTGPIFVCTRNDVLGAVVDATPASRREDLVFIQNGMLAPWLESRGLSEATQVLVYFAVATLGDPPLDGKTDTNPEGLTAVTGKWAAATAARLHAAGLSCKVLDAEAFKKPMLEKLIWICAFMLVGARHPGATVGIVEKEHRNEVVDLINELAGAASAEMQTEFDAGVEDRLCAYARSVAHFPTAVKEFEWRNGWFYEISKRALEGGKDDPCPLHTAWLTELGVIKS